MKRIVATIGFSLLCMGWGCSADNTTEQPRIHTTLEVSENCIVASPEGATAYITIETNEKWTSNAGAGIKVVPASGGNGVTSATVTIGRTEEGAAHLSELLITSGNTIRQHLITVIQATTDYLLVSPLNVPEVATEGGKLVFKVASDGEYTVDTQCDWIAAPETGEINPQVKSLTFTIPVNAGRSRGTDILFKGKNSTVAVTVTQNGTRDIPDREGATVKGEVTCKGIPLKGVVVSDGFEVTTTNDEGLYWLESKKKNGSVFISVPGGYMVDLDGSFPQFWQPTQAAADAVEVISFSLREEPNTEHILLATTDTHMANRQNYNPIYNDTEQYRTDFRPDIEKFVQQNAGKRIYAICLGDLAWDIYWYDKGTLYTLEDYRKEVADFPVPYFQVIGNHDYDMKFTDDFEATGAFRRIIGPTYYSFNLGDVHYVVLDDMYYINTDGNRSHDTYVDDEQLAWLRKDLSYVDKSKPVFVCMHCAAYDISGVTENGITVRENFKGSKTAELGDCFKGFSAVHYLTGDTHINRAVAGEDMPAGYGNIFEHNMGAVCATWWWTGYISRNSICKDGSEGGYMIFTNNGNDVRWRWKGMKVAADKQFRTYDMNTVKTFFATDPGAVAFRKKYPSRPSYANVADNTVWINVWNWDSGWKIVVRENGAPLEVKQFRGEDPLHTLSYDIPRTVANGDLTSSFKTYSTTHLFSAETASATSTLEIEVTDRFGTVYTETMTRPKEYSTTMP